MSDAEKLEAMEKRLATLEKNFKTVAEAVREFGRKDRFYDKEHTHSTELANTLDRMLLRIR